MVKTHHITEAGLRLTYSKRITSVTALPVANSAYYRYLPFAVFIGFIGLEEFIRLLASPGLINIESTTLYFLYPVKAVAIGCILYKF